MFKNSKKSYKGIPVIAANMDTVGTFEMAVALAKVTIKFICRLFSLFFSFSPSTLSLLFLPCTHTPSVPLFLHCSFAFLSGIHSLHHVPLVPDVLLLSSFITLIPKLLIASTINSLTNQLLLLLLFYTIPCVITVSFLFCDYLRA